MKPNFEKNTDGLLPVIIQDYDTMGVLMLGYMNQEAYNKTLKEQRVCFYSRSKQRLWIKGETSGNYLEVNNISVDCDQDAILITAIPKGPVCHTGDKTCFGSANLQENVLRSLQRTITERKQKPIENSYTSSLFQAGINKIAQKMGEEAIEVVIEAKDNDRQKFLNEAADLLFHYLVLLQAKNCSLADVEQVLKARGKK